MIDTKQEKFQIEIELLQPWSTFVMKTQLPPLILEKMLKITDEIVENREGRSVDVGAGQMKDQFEIPFKILDQEELVEFFLDVCRNYVIQAFCQSQPFDKESILKEEYWTQLNGMRVNSQKDNEYFPIHQHLGCHLSSVMYLKIPEYLPSRKNYGKGNDDGSIIFVNNASRDQNWGKPELRIQPRVGDFFIFPALQQHFVYPFRTADGKGERRSAAFNAIFTSKTEQDTLKKEEEAM